jgi:oligopeptide/dipeptide ABC transporter ATP-binding protein
MEKEPLLQVKDLKTYFSTGSGYVKSVDGISFEVYRRETLGIVGESGSGKSVTALSILGLLPKPQGRIISGSLLYGDRDLAKISEREIRSIRGNEISMIFQEPMTCLNPVYTVNRQISEAVRIHTDLSKGDAEALVVDMLRKVGIPDPERRARSFPHEMSGGMRQRVMIAMALSCNPQILIADEPTTALDVTIQAQILELLKSLQRQIGMSIILITHDLGIVAETADRVAVMYAGRIAEYASTRELFKRPFHPYTRGLLDSIPAINKESKRLYAIPGMVPSPSNIPHGCRFNNRCPYADETCFKESPPFQEAEAGHWVGCWHRERVAGEKKE